MLRFVSSRFRFRFRFRFARSFRPFAFAGFRSVATPLFLTLCHTFARRCFRSLSVALWLCWSVGVVCLSIYFARSPFPSRGAPFPLRCVFEYLFLCSFSHAVSEIILPCSALAVSFLYICFSLCPSVSRLYSLSALPVRPLWCCLFCRV